jgi:hypothetical protein
VRRWIGILGLIGCEGSEEPKDPITPGEPCDWAGAPELQAGFDLAAQGPVGPEDELPYGQPPQGGAPYAPFQVRAHVQWDDAALPRWLVTGVAIERSTGVEIAAAEQPQTFFCSNTGPHNGWLYGGEVHLRFPNDTLEELEGRVVDVALRMTLEDGTELEATGGGALAWTLGFRPE